MTRSGKARAPQVRAVRAGGWTKGKRATFLRLLGETGNVTLAAKATGLSPRGAHALRQRDGGFAILWAQALEAGYERLENELLFCALGKPTIDHNPAADEVEAAQVPEVPFDPALAIKVLQLRRGLRPPGTPVARSTMSQSEVDAALMQRLDTLAAKAP